MTDEHLPPKVKPKRIRTKAKRDRGLFDLQGGPSLEIKLDWQAYFRRFSETHGGNPVELDGRLVFADGWGHSSTDYKGPEWPPPADVNAKDELLRRYWEERAGIVRDELKALRIARDGVVQASIYRSLPLMRRVKVEDELTGKMVTSAQEVGTVAHDQRIAWLESDLENCERELKELNHGTIAEAHPQLEGRGGTDVPPQ